MGNSKELLVLLKLSRKYIVPTETDCMRSCERVKSGKLPSYVRDNES